MGTIFSLGKIAVENGAKPFGVAQFQAMFAGIVLLFISVIRRKSDWHMKDKLGFIFCVAMLGAAILLFCFISQQRTCSCGCIVDHSRADPSDDLRVFYPT